MKIIRTLPEKLKVIYESPEKLYYKGDISLMAKPSIAVVGTRRYSDYGKYVTEKIVSELSTYDISIISGLAKGIDTIAHMSALKNNIPTIAVLGSGFMDIYPKENEQLADEISKKGLLLSEYTPETPPLKAYFPQRNRIVAGLSNAVLVIEAPIRSGALITARLALEQGKEIFVTPGDIDRRNSTGILRLLQRGGAYPVGSANEILEVLNLPKRKTNQPSLFTQDGPKLKVTIEEQTIISALSQTRPQPLEIIQRKTKIETQTLLVALSMLEVQGLIKLEDGNYLLT